MSSTSASTCATSETRAVRSRQRSSGSSRRSRWPPPTPCSRTTRFTPPAGFAEASETRSAPADLIGRRPYDPAVAGVIASANGWRRFVRAVANASSLAVRTTTICS